MLRAPRKELLPFGGGEGVVVGLSATADVAVAFDVVGEADSDRLVGEAGVAQMRGIVGADGGRVVGEAFEEVPNSNRNLSKAAEVANKVIGVINLGLAAGARGRRRSRRGQPRGWGQAGGRRGRRRPGQVEARAVEPG